MHQTKYRIGDVVETTEEYANAGFEKTYINGTIVKVDEFMNCVNIRTFDGLVGWINEDWIRLVKNKVV